MYRINNKLHHKMCNQWDRCKKRLVPLVRQRLGESCFYCCIPNAPTIDHLVPLKRGGTNDLENLVPCCNRCNSQKGSKTLEEFRQWRHNVLACEDGQAMSTIRVSKTKEYSVVSNYAANDQRLSWKAKGVLYYLLTKPDSWTVNRENLVHMASDGETAVRSALCELESAGYLRRFKKQLPNGRFEWESVLYEEPICGKPPVGNPPMVYPHVDKTPLVNTDGVNTDGVNTPLPPEGDVGFSILSEEELAEVDAFSGVAPAPPRRSRTRQSDDRESKAKTLISAFRAARFNTPPGAAVPPAEYDPVKQSAFDLIAINATEDEVIHATRTAMATWPNPNAVTLNSVARNWTSLLSQSVPEANDEEQCGVLDNVSDATMARLGMTNKAKAYALLAEARSWIESPLGQNIGKYQRGNPEHYEMMISEALIRKEEKGL